MVEKACRFELFNFWWSAVDPLGRTWTLPKRYQNATKIRCHFYGLGAAFESSGRSAYHATRLETPPAARNRPQWAPSPFPGYVRERFRIAARRDAPSRCQPTQRVQIFS